MILTLLNDYTYFIEIFIANIIFLIPLKKSKMFIIKLTGVILFSILINKLILTLFFINTELQYAAIYYILVFVLISLPIFYLLADITFPEVIFYSICAQAMQHFASAFHLLFWDSSTDFWFSKDYFIVYGLTFIIFYIIFARKLPKFINYRLSLKNSIFSMAIVLPITIFLSIAIKIFKSTGNIDIMFKTAQIYVMLCCFFILWSYKTYLKEIFLNEELKIEQYLRNEQQNQFELSSKNIEYINHKCHDLKYQVNALRYVSENSREDFIKNIEASIDIYDQSIYTGNKVLDIILQEKSLYCKSHNIMWTSMIEGELLNFIETIDLYTITGNALDNAIECAEKLKSIEKKIISVKIYKKNNFVMFQIENHYEDKIVFKNSLPETTKNRTVSHGIGIKSIKRIVESYGGNISIKTDNFTFKLQILFPVNIG